jgi:hypothetical protein
MMKLHLTLLVAFALAGPAVAGDYGTFSPGSAPKQLPGYHPPNLSPPSAPRPPASPSLPTPGGFKPYEPFKGSSVYTQPKPATSGAKPCERSVYVNACGKY